MYRVQEVQQQRREKPQKSHRTFLHDEEGSAYIFTAIGLVVMLAFVGVALDMGNWYYQRHQMQVADAAAAMAAALELARDGATTADATARGQAVATANGYTTGPYVNVVVGTPPQSGSHQLDPAYVEAVITQDTIGFVNTAISSGSTDIGSRAVATATATLSNSCIYSLNPGATSHAIDVSGSAVANLNCGVVANSTAADAINVNGTACWNATNLVTVGGISNSGDPTCQTAKEETGAPAVEDPFAYLTPPTLGMCDFPGNVNNSNTDKNFGGADDLDFDGIFYFCAKVKFNGGNITFESGYIFAFDTDGLELGGGASLTGNGVMIYFPPTASGPNSGGPDLKQHILKISGSAPVPLSAMKSGPYKGILFYQDPSPLTLDIKVGSGGGSNINLTGVLYFPEAHVKFHGNSSNASPWAVLIADTVDIQGSSNFSAGAIPAGAAPLALSQPALTLTE